MKKNSQNHSPALLFACAALGLACIGKTASAQTLTLVSPTVNDGSFESVTAAKPLFTSPASATSSIPYWGATLVNTAGNAVATPTNSGSQTNGPGNFAEDDTQGSFYQPQPSSTAFNLVTTRAIQLGDSFTLTWYAQATGNGGTQVVSLFSQATTTVTGATYTYQPTAILATGDGGTDINYTLAPPGATNNFNQYTLNYTAVAGDVGNYIGFTVGNSGTAGFISEDNFNLSVTAAAIPEPSTYVLLGAGLGGLLLFRRSRRASV